MPTYSPNFLSSREISGTRDVYATAVQDYTGLTVNPTIGGTDLVLGQGFFADFNYHSNVTLTADNWAGIGLFSEVVSTNTAWEPKGSYFLTETAYIEPSTENVGAVISVTVDAGGSGYTVAPIVTFSSGTATATATLATTGAVAFIDLNNGGSGYTTTPTVTITGGTGSGATATATLSGNAVASIEVNNGGSGYTTTPTVTISGSGGSGATATATIGFPVSTVPVTSGGSGYTTPPIVTICGGSGATATATIDSTGTVTSIEVNNGGSGYTTTPTVTITGGTGSGATATATLSGNAVASIEVNNGGSGYTSAPTVTITDRGGSGATATATVSDDSQRVDSRLSGITSGSFYSFLVGGASKTSLTVDATANSEPISFGNSKTLTATTSIITGAVTSIEVNNGGSGYTTTPTVTITGGTGSGATATAVLSGDAVASVLVTTGGSGYTSAPDVRIAPPPNTASGGVTAVASASLIKNLQNMIMASQGATGEDDYVYDITPQKAVVSRSKGDLYTFNYPDKSNANNEIYEFATGGDGVVAIGATDSFISISGDASSDAVFTADPFTASTTGNFAWPDPSEIQVSDTAFLTNSPEQIYRSRSYGHCYTMALGLNFDLGTDDGNDINLATNWSYSDFFRGDSDNRYTAGKPSSGKSGWKIQPTFDMSGLTTTFPISGIDEKAARAFVNIKNLLTTISEPMVWLGALAHACDPDNNNHPLPANRAALDDWESIPFAAPVDSSDPPVPLVTTANFKDYSEVDEAADLLSSFGLNTSRLSVERSLGTTVSYTRGDTHAIWENKDGTSRVETKFPCTGDDGEWGYWEKANFNKLVSYSQTGTVKATTSSTTKVNSDEIGKEMVKTNNAISFGYTWVPLVSLGVNLSGVKTTFGHTPPSTVDIDAGISRYELNAGVNTNSITFSSIINGSAVGGDENKTTVTANKYQAFIGGPHNFLSGGPVRVRQGNVGGKVDIGLTDLKSSLLRSFYNLEKAQAHAAKLNSSGVAAVAETTADASAIGNNSAHMDASTTTTEEVGDEQDSPVRPNLDAERGSNQRQSSTNPADNVDLETGRGRTGSEQSDAAATGQVQSTEPKTQPKPAQDQGIYSAKGEFAKRLRRGWAKPRKGSL